MFGRSSSVGLATSQVDPKGPSRGTERVIRGGAWNGGYPSWVRPTFRYKDTPEKRALKLTWNATAICTVGVPVARERGYFTEGEGTDAR